LGVAAKTRYAYYQEYKKLHGIDDGNGILDIDDIAELKKTYEQRSGALV
jgi:hypothetical protein